MKILYHVSKTENLKELEPRVCSHGKAYVYASYHKETALLFGGSLWSDWDFIYKRNYQTGELTFSETYPGEFQKVFAEKTCILYEVEDSGFKQGQTNMWDEIVSQQKTRVLKERKITNLLDELKELEKIGKIKLEKYSDDECYKEKVKKHILNLTKYSDIYKQHNTSLLIEKFEDILKDNARQLL